MDTSNRVLLIAVILITLLVVAIFLQPRVEEELLPELVAAWVGIEVEGSGTAVVGRVEVASSASFTLRAILEGRARNGDRVLYTEAKGVELGGEVVPTEEIRPWNRHGIVRVRWSTVEGERPFVRLEGRTLDEAIRYGVFVRTEWPQTWSIPGELAPAHDDHLAVLGAPEYGDPPFGTQRYRVQFEFYRHDEDLIPRRKVASWGADRLPGSWEGFSTVMSSPSPQLSAVTAVFGLPHVEIGTEPELDVLKGLAEKTRQGLAWTGLTVLSAHVQAAGRRFGDLEWTPVDLPGGARWGETLEVGDLLRVGERVVVLYRDDGGEGGLDYEDLCLDFALGASIVPLRDVFSGEGLTVEHASLR